MMELVAALAAEIIGTAPEWIMYAPAGRNSISAKVNGKPARVTITVEEDAAKALQADLMARKAAGGPQPFFDFHHDGREASAYPKEFQWREDGVWARVKWTHAGLLATKADPENGIAASVPYFSPRCAIANGRIVGLMDASTGNAAGGLVSDPAFERIKPAALVASLTPNPDNIMDPMKARMRKMLEIEDGVEMDDEELMSKLEAAMCGYGKKKDMSAAKVADLEAAKASAESERDAIKAELAAAKAELEAARTEAAESFVAELVASGKVPPKSETRKEFLRKSFLADPEGTRAYAAELTASNPGNERITDDSNAKNPGESPADKGTLRSAKANELLAAKAAPTFEAAWQVACELIP
jgi:outer membrane murein-binding lipoprotein Lpp